MEIAPPLAIDIRGLTKTYRSLSGPDVRALDGLNLQVPTGGVHALLGPNGSGKTTLLRLLLGLMRADSGSVTLLGEPQPAGLERVIDRIGALVEYPRFFPSFTVKQTLSLFADAIEADPERIGVALTQVGLTGRENTHVGALSLGMKQRLAIASTLLKNPDLFLFDEPTNGLDPAGIHEIRTTIRRLGDEGRTVLLSSHLLAEVQQVADHVSIIDRGRLVASGPVRELLAGASRGVRVAVQPVDHAADVLRNAGFSVDVQTDGRLLVTGKDAHPRAVNQALVAADLWVDEIAPQAADLEAAFLQLTEGNRA